MAVSSRNFKKFVLPLMFAVAAPQFAAASMVTHAQRLVPPDGVPNGSVYLSLAVSGDWIAAFGRLSPMSGDGRVFVFHRSAGTWEFFQTLTPADSADCVDALAFNNEAVFSATNRPGSLAAPALFVGCGTAYDSVQGANVGLVSGYSFDGMQWNLAQTLRTATGYVGASGFGTSLAVADNQLFVGFTGNTPQAQVVQTGTVEVYDASAFPVNLVSQLYPSYPAPGASFGSSLAAVSGHVAVGANTQSVASIGENVGAVYTFTSASGQWQDESYLIEAHPYAEDFFPTALTYQGNELIAGSAYNNSFSKGGPLGVALAYTSVIGGLSLCDAWYPQDSVGNSMFGQALAAIDKAVFVGEPFGGDRGLIHMYTSYYGNWLQTSSFTTDLALEFDSLGVSMATDGLTLVFGSAESSRAPSSMGSIYVVDAPPTDQVFGEGFEQ